jgi:hypothetical protein
MLAMISVMIGIGLIRNIDPNSVTNVKFWHGDWVVAPFGGAGFIAVIRVSD